MDFKQMPKIIRGTIIIIIHQHITFQRQNIYLSIYIHGSRREKTQYWKKFGEWNKGDEIPLYDLLLISDLIIYLELVGAATLLGFILVGMNNKI